MPEGPFGSGFNQLDELLKGLVSGLEESLGGALAPDRPDEPGRNDRSHRRTPTLDRFGRDLTAEARAGKLDPVIGRDAEVAELLEVLSRRTKNNPVLIGDPGVGKTAIVEGVAARIADDTAGKALRGRRLIVLDLAGLVAGTRYRGDFEERFGAVIGEVLGSDRNVLLFLDELHTIIGAGGAEGAPMDAGSMLKPALARGGLQLIGATTVEEYRKHLERDAALERRFQPILIAEPSVADTTAILLGLRARYETHHQVRITEAAAEAAARLSDRYLTDRFLPDKAIDLMDRAGARVRMRADSPGAPSVPDGAPVTKRVAVGADGVATLGTVPGIVEVTEDDVADVVASITGIPVARLTELDRHRLLHLEELLAERVVGQTDAVRVVADAVRSGRAGLTHPGRPVGSFLFLGPTGVGKTELAMALAGVLFGEQDRLVRLDMTEFGDRHTVSRLVGAPPGYVGHEEAGQLTDAVRRTPYTVVLLDEIEKAHPDVLGVLLQVLDAGRLTDARGRTVDFTNTVIIMTSNLGAEALLAASAAGRSVEEVRDPLMGVVRGHFRPEFLNRIDEVVLFLGLDRAQLRAITELLLTETRQRLQARQIGMHLDVAAVDWLAERGYQPEYGARPLRRTIGRELERHLSRLLLGGELSGGHDVRATVAPDGERLEFTIVAAQHP